jgi:quercetin 2,3-dioxygenase
MIWLAGFIRKRSPSWKLKKLGLEVDFCDRPDGLSESQWHPVAGPEASDAPLKIRQQVIVCDARLREGGELSVPRAQGMTSRLYIMDRAIRAGDERLGKGDAVTNLDGACPVVDTESPATLATLLVDRSAPGSTAGTISGR